MDIHLDVKSYTCMKCGRGFARYSNARSHEKNCRQKAVPVSDSWELYMTDIELSDDEKMDANGYWLVNAVDL